MKKVTKFIKRNIVLLTLLGAVLCLVLSFTLGAKSPDFSSVAQGLQNKLQDREAILDKYAFQALDFPSDEWIELADLPEDMVIYRYHSDTLQSWAHQFPFANDELRASSIYQIYRSEHYLDGQARFTYPFSYLGSKQQYVNIGSGWFLIKSYLKDDLRVIAGLLVKTDSQVAQAIGAGEINPKLDLPEGYDIYPLALESSGAEIMASDNEPLFLLVADPSSRISSVVSPLVWISMAFAALFFFFLLVKKRTLGRLLVYLLGITALRLLAFSLGDGSSYSSNFFSPAVYADDMIFSSIGDLLLNNLYVSLLFLGIYMLRSRYLDKIKNGNGRRRWLGTAVLCLLPLALGFYINYTLRSLILNSSINMELHRVTSISLYTVLCYFSYAVLFLMLMFSLQLVISLMGMKRKRGLLSIRNTILFALGVSVYMLLTVSSLSGRKEAQWSRLLANRLSVERDLGLELELREIEDRLLADPVSGALLTMPQENLQMLQMRFSELYFQSIRQKYVINMSVCRPNESIQVGQMMVNCLDYYRAKMAQYDAVPIADNSAFFYLSNYNGQVGYLGLFTYLVPSGNVNLFIEISPRYDEGQAGYPDRFSDYQPDDVNIPSVYSYAKYFQGRLVHSRGRYDYPVYEESFKDGKIHRDGFLHRVIKVTDQNTVVISRPERTVFPYIVSLSYLVLFFSFFFLGVIRIKRARIRARAVLKRTRKSWGRRLNFLITMLISGALLAATMGSLYYSVNYYKLQNRMQMEEKIKTVGKSLSSFFTYVQDYSDVNASELTAVLDRLANDSHVDINLYDPSGKVFLSTKMDLFRKNILSSRMNSEAFEDIVVRHRSQAFNREKLGSYRYYSLYCPIFNYNGKLVAIADIPYFTRGGDLNGDLSYVVATIVNISILLFVLALFLSRLLFSRVTRPLTEISSKMKSMDVSSAPEHINYASKDELGLLVEAYNKMVDDVSESTKRMAAAEREKAWSDMARQIAHEIKNPLTPMKLSIQRIIRLKERNDPGWEDKLDEISQTLLGHIDRLANTASEFSSYAKFYVEADSLFNLYQTVKEQKEFFDNNDNIRIMFTHSSEDCPVYARKEQIVRVLVNLISNAVQELEHSQDKGFIRLGLSREGDMWKVSVEDNGRGVNEENLDKLFQPNFTTKTTGNGLGLAISRSIIEQSGGKIWYEQSELGGACFAFTLPVYDKENIQKQ